MDKRVTANQPWRPEPTSQSDKVHPPETLQKSMEFLSNSFSASAIDISKAAINPSKRVFSEEDGAVTERNPFCFASSETSKTVMERIMSQSESGRLSHSSGPLNGSFTDSSSVSPEIDHVKHGRLNNQTNLPYQSAINLTGVAQSAAIAKNAGRRIKDRRDKKKEEMRAHNAQLHAKVSVAGLASAVAAMAALTAASSGAGKDQETAQTDVAVASAATLVAAQCVEAAEAMGADRELLASVVKSAVHVQSAADVMMLTKAASTALHGAAKMKARALKDVLNIAAVLPAEKGMSMSIGSNSSSRSHSGELFLEENFLGIGSRELLAGGCELLKRTRNGDLHWKIVSVYINRMNKVTLKMQSKHIAGTLTKNKKYEVIEVIKDMPPWSGRHLLEGGDCRRYFGLNTIARGVVEFECRSHKEYENWTVGVSKLLALSINRRSRIGL